MPSIEIINPIAYPSWDDLVLSTKNYCFFHTSHWAKVLSESYCFKPLYFTAFENGKFLAAIPIMEIRSGLTGRRGISLPFSDYCPPLVSTGEVALHDLWNEIEEYGEKSDWKYIEFRGGEKFFRYIFPASSSSYYRHTLNLRKGEKALFSFFRDSTRKNVKKSIREGVETQTYNSLESMQEFYRLHCITRKRIGVPPQPLYFFKNVYDHVVSQDHGMVLLAFFKKEAIAGGLFLHFGKKAIYKYAASDIKYQHLRPNNLVMWEAIRKYSQDGYEDFCLGRTDEDNYGLLQFKNGWNNEKRIICYYNYDLKRKVILNNKRNYNHIPRRILKKLPVKMLNYLGLLLYRHVG